MFRNKRKTRVIQKRKSEACESNVRACEHVKKYGDEGHTLKACVLVGLNDTSVDVLVEKKQNSTSHVI